MGVRSPSDKLELIDYTPPPTGDHDVLVDVQFCGVSDSAPAVIGPNAALPHARARRA
jgi:hypothetical protein